MKWILIIFLPMSAFASTMQYFDTKIDFWGEAQKVDTPTPLATPVKDSSEEFPWTTYLDPKNKEFFKEGDYTPPEPFMEVARNPSDDNLKSWFEFMKKKNDLARRLETKMQEYLAKNTNTVLPVALAAPLSASQPKEPQQHTHIDPERFHLRMYFESTCPHCRRMFSVLKHFKDEGFAVEALQVDSGPIPEAEKVVPIGKADPTELKAHNVQGVPFLLIADVKKKAILPPVEGYHEYDEMLSLLKAASQN